MSDSTNYNLSAVLHECVKSAQEGFIKASKHNRSLTATIDDSRREINNAILAIENSNYTDSVMQQALHLQLSETEKLFNALQTTFEVDLKTLRKRRRQFSVTLFGRSMTGKSTLMEVLVEGDGKSIGKGAQRTTRDIRKYSWNGLTITDVPGIGAFEGEDDEKTAFDEAKAGDIIIFLITDGAPQPVEADFFSRIIDLGKPVICVMNVQVSIPSNKNIKLILRDLSRAFDHNRLDEIKKQFITYGLKRGQEWDNIPFVYTHLDAAFKAQTIENQEHAKLLKEASCIEVLKQEIYKQVLDKGRFFRIKTFIDAIAKPLLDAEIILLKQSNENITNEALLLSKCRQLSRWTNKFERDSIREIHYLVEHIKQQLYSQTAVFAEEHVGHSDANEKWKEIVDSCFIDAKCQDLLERFQDQCNDQIREVAREISKESKYIQFLEYENISKEKKIYDLKKIWNWTTLTISLGTWASSGIATLLGASLAGPLGWAAIGATAIGTLGSIVFKSQDKREQEARKALEGKLQKNIDSICSSLETKLTAKFKDLKKNKTDALLDEMKAVSINIHTLANTQMQLAWRLNKHTLELNFEIVSEALKILHKTEELPNIVKVGRVLGKVLLFELKSRSKLSDECKMQLQRLMSEKVRLVSETKSKRALISRILDKTIKRGSIVINDSMDIANVKSPAFSDELNDNIILAQQLSKTIINAEVIENVYAS